MRLLLGLLLAFAVAAVVGLGTTLLALSHGMAFGAFTIGSWTAWPRTGTADIDPYARAVLARTGELPMGSGDGIAFLLRGAKERSGRPFDAQVAALREQQVEFRVCGNTLAAHNVASELVLQDAAIVPAGVAEIARLQAQEGYVYIRP